jgi:exosortase
VSNSAAAAAGAVSAPDSAWTPKTNLVLAGFVLLAGVWSYWPTLCELVATWEREPDYSHGYLVVPIAILFLWLRRKSFPGMAAAAIPLGLGLLAVSLFIRAADALFFLRFLDGYSILPWAAAVVAMLFGARVLRWALPSIGFLFFMIPIPFSAETALSYPLQRIATKLSCAALQLLGQPAFAEGNVILLGQHELEVAQACSGLRLFMSVVALAFCYVVLVRRSAWEKAFLVAMVGPIAILSNSLRIVATGLLYQYASSEVGRSFAHDFAGWAMIPVAAALFGVVLWYLANLTRGEEELQVGALIRKLEASSDL